MPPNVLAHCEECGRRIEAGLDADYIDGQSVSAPFSEIHECDYCELLYCGDCIDTHKD